MGTGGNDPSIVDVPKNQSSSLSRFKAGQWISRQSLGACARTGTRLPLKKGLSEAVNVEQEEFLEGQAFYTCLAPSQYVLPKVNSVVATQTANAAKQKKCAQTLTSMLKLNTVSAGTKTDDA